MGGCPGPRRGLSREPGNDLSHRRDPMFFSLPRKHLIHPRIGNWGKDQTAVWYNASKEYQL